MAMNWIYRNRQGVGVLGLRGYLGNSSLADFTGAVGWVLARRTGPVVVDLTGLQGCSASGHAALGGEAAERAAAAGRVFAVCGPHGIDAQRTWQGQRAAIPVYADLGAAVAALRPRQREIRLRGWGRDVGPIGSAPPGIP